MKAIDERVKKLVDFSQGLDKKLKAEAEERKKMGASLKDAMNKSKDMDIVKKTIKEL